MKHLLFLSILIFDCSFLWGRDTITYYMEIDVNAKGDLVGRKRFQNHLGNYLYSIQNTQVIQVKERDGFIIEFNTQDKNFYAVYNDTGRIQEIGERNRGATGKEFSRKHRYNGEGLLERIDHYEVQEDRVTFRYHPTGVTHLEYKDHKLIRDRTERKGEPIQKSEYYYEGERLVRKEIHTINPKGRTLYTYTYNEKHQLIKESKTTNDQLTEQQSYTYSATGLHKINSQIYALTYYTNTQQEATHTFQQGIQSRGILFAGEEIVELSGILPNTDSYIQYKFTHGPYKHTHSDTEEAHAIHAQFTNHSIPEQRILNTVEIISDFLGKELTLRWYNERGEELFNNIPREIRYMRSFHINTLLNTKHIILGKLSAPNPESIQNEIIVEIYEKETQQRYWCYFGNGYYYYTIQYSDKAQNFNTIHVLKAGFRYERVSIDIDPSKTIHEVDTIHLQAVQ